MDRYERSQIIGKKLKTSRESQGYSQQQVADKMGFSRALYARYEHGNDYIPADRLQMTAAILQIELNDLLP